MSIIYRVWNKKKTHKFDTESKYLAYEVRKGASSNVWHDDLKHQTEARKFCYDWSENEDCTSEVINA